MPEIIEKKYECRVCLPLLTCQADKIPDDRSPACGRFRIPYWELALPSRQDVMKIMAEALRNACRWCRYLEPTGGSDYSTTCSERHNCSIPKALAAYEKEKGADQ